MPLLDQRLETMQRKFDAENALRNSQLESVIRQISDISTGRAPLNISVHIPVDGRQPPAITTDYVSSAAPVLDEGTNVEASVSNNDTTTTLSVGDNRKNNI